MKVITWNVNKASLSRDGVWTMLEQEDADIVLLQEVTRIPDEILRRYNTTPPSYGCRRAVSGHPG